MNETIGIGLSLVLLGGFLQGSFALPMKRMSLWRWENTWFIYSIAGMVALPWIIAIVTIPHFWVALGSTPAEVVAEIALFGFGWGVGSTLFGLGISRVGMALTFAIVLGITASLGSLLPLLIRHPGQLYTRQGHLLELGLGIVVAGIAVCSIAGRRRERELNAQAAQRGGASFGWGILICILSGIFSAMLNFSFVFGKTLQQKALALGATPSMAPNLIWAVALSAGFLANGGYCVYLMSKNRTWGTFAGSRAPLIYWGGAVVMGVVWFLGIAAYGSGATGLGDLGAVLGWPLFMAMNITTASVWGAATGEWKGASRRTYVYSWAGIAVLLAAIYVISRASVA